MRLGAAPLAASVVLLLILNVPLADAQSDEGVMKVNSKISLTGLSALNGSGTATITFTEKAAIDLRHLIIDVYGMGDQRLNTEDVRNFLQAISDALIGSPYWGFTIESATNFTQKTDKYVNDHTSGLDSAGLYTTDPLSFEVGFEGTGSGATKDITLVESTYVVFANAVRTASGYNYVGEFVVDTSISTLGICSLTGPHLEEGRISAIRLPWGEMLWYEWTGDVGSGDLPRERITYETFSAMENQLVSFIVLLIGVILILRTPGKRFDKYEKLHPRKFRKYAKPLIEVRLSAYILAAVCLVLYLFPYIFSFTSPDALFYSVYVYAAVVLAFVAEWMFSRFMYDRAAIEIPEESVIEVKQAIVQPSEGEGEILCKVCYRPIEAGLEMFQCSCGLTMHVDCAQKAQNCPSCGQPLVQLRTRSIQCRVCDETFLHSGDEDSYSIQCTKCGAFQDEIKARKNYLIADSDPRNAFMMIRAMGLSDKPAMCLTTSFPGKVRSDYDLKDVAIKWFSDSVTDIDNVNPKDLDVDAMETISTFLMTTKGAGVLIDGIDSLIELNGFDKVLSFIKKVNDLAATHGSSIILSLDKTKLTREQFKAIGDVYDEVHDYQ